MSQEVCSWPATLILGLSHYLYEGAGIKAFKTLSVWCATHALLTQPEESEEDGVTTTRVFIKWFLTTEHEVIKVQTKAMCPTHKMYYPPSVLSSPCCSVIVQVLTIWLPPFLTTLLSPFFHLNHHAINDSFHLPTILSPVFLSFPRDFHIGP